MDRFSDAAGISRTKLTASRNKKLTVTTLRESGSTREEYIDMARHMAHNVTTADKYYDQSRTNDDRFSVLDRVQNTYKVN